MGGKRTAFALLLPANRLRNNYVLFNHFLVTTKTTKNWRYCNVISVRNSNMPKYSVILTSSKMRNYIQQMNNLIVTLWKIHHNDEPKSNVIITKITYVMQTYYKNVIVTSLEWLYCNKKG